MLTQSEIKEIAAELFRLMKEHEETRLDNEFAAADPDFAKKQDALFRATRRAAREKGEI